MGSNDCKMCHRPSKLIKHNCKTSRVIQNYLSVKCPKCLMSTVKNILDNTYNHQSKGTPYRDPLVITFSGRIKLECTCRISNFKVQFPPS